MQLEYVVVVLVLSVATSCAEDSLPWWRNAVLYQVYPRSFMDSDGDGVGDLKGITKRAEYLKDLGVTAVWMNPIFPSPLKDFGYDISDFRAIDPTYGTVEDFKELLNKLNELGIKLLVDLVPNHSSDQHEWFRKSVQKEEPFTDYYVWQNGTIDPKSGKRAPPNNWVSVLGGCSWEWNEDRQQFYLHQFLTSQPDLNYRNAAVVREVDNVIRFWLELGVDGFRVDAVAWLFEDPRLEDEPEFRETDGQYREDLLLPHTKNLPETYQLLDHWEHIIYNYTLQDGKHRAMFIEAYVDHPRVMRYYGTNNSSPRQPFNFDLLVYGNQSSSAEDLRKLIAGWISDMPEDFLPNWVVGNHDNGRVANRYGPEMVDAINLLTGTLPGVMAVYYGEEIGMQDTFIRYENTVDPRGRQLGPRGYLTSSRDPSRTPMQWDDTTNAGFSTNSSTWLPVNPNYWWLNVAAQKAATTSHLKVFTAIVEARKDPVMQMGDLQVIAPNNDILIVLRAYNGSSYKLVINVGDQETSCTLDEVMKVVVSSLSANYTPGTELEEVSLRPKAAVLFKSPQATRLI